MFFIGTIAGAYCVAVYGTNYAMYSGKIARGPLSIADFAFSPVTVPAKLLLLVGLDVSQRIFNHFDR